MMKKEEQHNYFVGKEKCFTITVPYFNEVMEPTGSEFNYESLE